MIKQYCTVIFIGTMIYMYVASLHDNAILVVASGM